MKKIHYLAFVAVLGAIGTIGVTNAFFGLPSIGVQATDTTYTLTLSSSNGALTNGSYSSSESVNSTAKTTSGNAFSFSYCSAMKSSNTSYAFAQMKKTSGYIYSTYGVKGLSSITVTFSTNDSLYLYTSDSSDFSSSTRYTLSSGVAFTDIEGDYWKIASGSNAVYVGKIEMTYTCSSVPVERTSVTGITLNKNSMTLEEGESETLTATVAPDNATVKTVEWSSSSPSVATVSNKGLVTAVSEGSTTITAKTVDGGFTATCSVNVTYSGDTYRLITSTSDLNPGDQIAISSAASGSAYLMKSAIVSTYYVAGVSATIADSSFRPVDDMGIYTVGNGTSAGTYSFLDEQSTDMGYLCGYISGTHYNAKFDSNLAANTSWSVSIDSTGAAVCKSGEDVYLKYDSTHYNYKGYSVESTVYLFKKTPSVVVPVESVSMTPSTLSLEVGQTSSVSVSVLPTNATNRGYVLSSSNTSVATVNSAGQIEALSVGTTTITATTNDGSKKATCSVTVKEVASPIAVTSISLSSTSLEMNVGDETTLTATILPSNATYKTVTWNSGDTSVATVTSGKVKAVAAGSTTITATSSNGLVATCSVTVTETLNYYKATADTTTKTFSYQGLENTYGGDCIPSKGMMELLVVPVELKGYSFSTQTLNDLDAAFNGNGKSDTGYWESLASYYKKSSFGELDMHFTIADKYVSSYTPATLYSSQSSSDYGVSYAATQMGIDVVSQYKSDHGSTSTQKFDSDGNGFIDAVIMVYSCPDMSASSAIAKIDPDYDLFWAFRWNYYESTANKTSPNVCNYFWMSYDFLYEEATSPNVDAHTLIHESGHLFGLDDYYCYDSVTPEPHPTGGFDMMDYNVGDQNVFSKMSLNWIKPYVVTGNCTITINPAETDGSCILVPTSNGWNGTAFDEYLIMELFTPTGLNELDCTTAYSTRPKGYTVPGVRLYHVDQRIAKYTSYNSTKEIDNGSYVSGVLSSFTAAGSNGYPYYGVAASNSSCRDNGPAYGTDFDLVRLIEAGGTNTFNNGKTGTNATLFKTGNTFSMSSYGSAFFPKKTTFNNGASLQYTISFESVTSTSATIKFTKTA